MKKLILLALITCLASNAFGQAVPPGGWTEDATIGTATPGSSVSPEKGVYEVTGNGNDIWDNADAFQFLYKELVGDGSMVARVVDDGTGSNTWAKGGVMIRQSTDPGSVHSMMIMTASDGNGASWQGRLTAGASSENSDAPSAVDEPYWVKIERIGNDFMGYISPDGADWTQMGSARTIVMNDPVLIGLCVTSHAAGELRTFTFDNISLTGEVSGEKDPGAASVLSPADEAVDVPRNPVLSWIAGDYPGSHDVYLGTSLEDVNDATRSDPKGVLVSQGQTALTFAPDTLAFEQTYYWRVDEVNSVGGAIFKSDVWSFTVEPFAYPVEDIVATTSATSDEGAGIENAINGSGLNAAGEHSIEAMDMWATAAGNPLPVTVDFEFPQIYKLDEMLVWNYNVQFEPMLGFGCKDVTVEYSSDGVEWTLLGDVVFTQGIATVGYAANTAIDFGGAPVKYVRLTINSGYGPLGQVGLSELKFMYVPAQPREPQPTDGAADVSVTTTLGWRGGREAVSHEVYFGTDPEALPLAGTVDTTTYAPGALDMDTSYSWQIVEVNEADEVTAWAGDVWSFTTQAFLVVDDFESYDNEDNVIYDTWTDGWINDTGSTVGHLIEPFAEQSVVKSGSQSMPFFFDNASVDTAEAEIDLTQDWTASGIQSLSLSFAGDAANSGGQLYVLINSTRVDYDGDASDLTRTIWQAWNIDLSTVGGNLSNVSSLTIGVEGAGANGVLYFDDIRLYSKTPEYITPTEPDAAGLVAHYTFDEGSGDTVADASGNGNDGIINGDSVWSTGVIGGAMTFGGNDYVDCGNDASLVIRDAITVACWIKVAAFVNDWETIISMGDDSYRMGRSATTGNAIHFGCNGPTGGNLDGNAIVTDDTWHHVALVYDGAYKIIYVDGVEDARVASTGQIDVSSYNLYIGENAQATGRYLHGLVDDARIYNRAMSAEEVAGLAGRTGVIHKPF